MTTKSEGSHHLLSAGHCSVCLPETPIAFLTGVTKGRMGTSPSNQLTPPGGMATLAYPALRRGPGFPVMRLLPDARLLPRARVT